MNKLLKNKIIYIVILLISLPILFMTFLALSFNIDSIPFPFEKKYEKFSFAKQSIICTINSKYDFKQKNNEIIDNLVNDHRNVFDQIILTKDSNIIYDTNNKLNGKNSNVFSKKNYLKIKFNQLPKHKDNEFIYLKLSKEYRNVQTLVSILPLSIILFLILIIVLGFISLSYYISKQFIKPLDELNKAIYEMSHGNFEFELNISNNSQLNEFSQKFILIKNTLETTLKEQRKYINSRNRLLSSITHDLRTPLSSIKGYIEAIQDGIVKDEKTYNEYLSVIQQKTDQLDLLIDDLFLFTKLENDQLNYQKNKINSKTFLLNYYNNKKLEFKNSKINFLIKKPVLSTIINIDANRISQLLDNLISNAKKFTNNLIEISTTLNKNYLVISVKDNGIGINKENQEKIFDLFYKSDLSRNQNSKKGSGIGLNICKKIIKAHNGKIKVTSNNKYTIFKVYIPLKLQ